jgi:hypothetical protein
LRPFLLTILVLVPLFAGCTGSEGGGAGRLVDLEDRGGEGDLRVLVIDDEYFPVAGADVYILELALNATTDGIGDAYFQGLPAGEWTVHAEGDGFLPNRTRTTVTSGDGAVARVSLPDRAPDILMMDFRREAGMCLLGAHVDPDPVEPQCRDAPYLQSHAVTFPLESNMVWAVLEMEWDAQGPLSEQMRFEVRFLEGAPFADGRDTITVEGESPLLVRLEPDMLTDQQKQRGHRLVVEASPAQNETASLMTAQAFEVFAQLVYFRPGASPDGHTHGA